MKQNKVYKRVCPTCNKEIIYKTYGGWYLGNKKNSSCKSCGNSGSNNGMYGRKGELNPFYKKKHSKEFIQFISNFHKNREYTEEQKEQARQQLQKVANHKHPYEIWKEKYGEEEANKRFKKMKEKHRQNAIGQKNNMYGKPSPQGSGNGWSGWYKGYFFRSLIELNYILYLDNNKIEWKTAESKLYKVEYIDPLGQQRNYFPDFIINNNEVIECKPKKLWNSPKNLTKFIAAKKYFNSIDLKFSVVDYGKPSVKTIEILINSNLLKFIEKYTKKYEEYKRKKNESDNP